VVRGLVDVGLSRIPREFQKFKIYKSKLREVCQWHLKIYNFKDSRS